MEGRDLVASVDVRRAAERVRGVVRRTPLVPIETPDRRLEVRLKLESQQETGSFKARGAWNQIAQLTAEERKAGVVTTSSGNHGRALAWAAQRAGVPATICMPENVYPIKLAACRELGAEVVLSPTRAGAEEECARRVAAGAILIHPYDAARTAEGAGTGGLEIAEDWPEVQVVLIPVGGGGLIGGSAKAIAETLGDEVPVIGVEPSGAPNMSRALEERKPVLIDPITTAVQGLCPLDVGAINLALAERYVEGMITLGDEEIFAGQRALLLAGHTVEPAGAAAFAAVLAGALPPEFLVGHDLDRPLRVACVVSGGNADPDQLAGLR